MSCLSCARSKAVGSYWAYCKKQMIMVALSGSCEFYADGLAQFRKHNQLDQLLTKRYRT